MNDPSRKLRLEQTLERLSAAVDYLESVGERRRALDVDVESVKEDVCRLEDDRARLAEALDGARTRADYLERVNRDVSNRLVTAMETIRAFLDRHRA